MKLTNHSTRKHLLQTMWELGFGMLSHWYHMQISGHKNEHNIINVSNIYLRLQTHSLQNRQILHKSSFVTNFQQLEIHKQFRSPPTLTSQRRHVFWGETVNISQLNVYYGD
ncbi:hypothetical protein DPMN_133994 [Dreissena polymorpha]|uniref:Uncharacterized protein n=1 Tax=Dreissena polymorpha TaxID=45954 RepID=A0A9D4JFD9_DREPO|nr:hypothetical protein DPMN_133994 [Dreissena polymorpha]